MGKIVRLNCLGKEHISGVGISLIAVAKLIKKKRLLAHLMLFLMLSGIFSISAISCSLVIRGLINIKFWRLKCRTLHR